MNDSFINHTKYIESLSHEIIAVKDRVRSIIGKAHWGEEGRYKEKVLANILEQKLPKNVSISSGFIIADGKVSTQIDIIIHNNSYSPCFKQGDFVIVFKEAVIGVIEVKTKLDSPTKIIRAVNAIVKIKKQFDIPHIFAGLFVLNDGLNIEEELKISHEASKLRADLSSHSKYVIDNIAFGKDYFMKYWSEGKPSSNYHSPHYSLYKIDNKAMGYFISNVIEHTHIILNNSSMSDDMGKFLYPIENGGKESYRIDECEIELRGENK